MSRKKRIDRIGLHVAPLPRFWAAMASMPAFLLINNLVLRSVLIVIFAVLAVLAGKKIRWTYFVMLVVSVTFFHLLAPWGRVIFEIGPLSVTAGALNNGLIKSLGLVGMVFISVAAVRPELELPGKLGGLLGRTFFYFDSIIESKTRLRRKDFFVSLDELLMEHFNPKEDNFLPERSGPYKKMNKASGSFGLGWVIAFVVFLWALLLLDFLELF